MRYRSTLVSIALVLAAVSGPVSASLILVTVQVPGPLPTHILLLTPLVCVSLLHIVRLPTTSHFSTVALIVVPLFVSAWVTDQSNQLRGFSIALSVAAPLLGTRIPFGQPGRIRVARSFLCAALVYLLMVVLLLPSSRGRFGSVVSADQGLVGNPNAAGYLFGAGAIMTIYLRKQSERVVERAAYAVAFSTLSGACVLTQSRGATASLLASLLFTASTRSMRSRLRYFAVLILILVVLVSPSGSALEQTPRVFDREELATFGERTGIWQASLRAWSDAPTFGQGIGDVDYAIGERGVAFAVFDDQGRARKAAHNIYIEWLVGLGIVGVLTGAYGIKRLIHDSGGIRSETASLWVYVAVAGIGTSVTRGAAWAAIVLVAASVTSGTVPVGTISSMPLRPGSWTE